MINQTKPPSLIKTNKQKNKPKQNPNKNLTNKPETQLIDLFEVVIE